MNGSKSPDAENAPDSSPNGGRDAAITTNGYQSPSRERSADERNHNTSTSERGADEHDAAELPDGRSIGGDRRTKSGNGEADDGASEAETLISSPVKRREMEKKKQANGVKSEPVESDKISDVVASKEDSPLPEDVPTPGQDVDAGLSVESGDLSPPKTDEREDKDRDDMSSDELADLSTVQSPLSSRASSRSSSRSRAYSDRPEVKHAATESPNPRKRKHRASSVSLPNKRPSIDPPKRRLRNANSDEQAVRDSRDRSDSPRLRSHRRTVSVQSGMADAAAEHSGRKRRGLTQFPVREPRPSKGWEGSDASSETTSTGQAEPKRSTRGVGRSTSTPGRPVGREHKRYVSKYGFTRMAEACEAGDLHSVKEWRKKDPDQLELSEFAGNTPLQIASLNGNAEIVEYLISQGVKTDCSNTDKDTPLIDASENGHLEVVVALLKANVDPMRTNSKGNAALDVVADDTDNATEIRAALRDAIDHWNSDGAKQRREEEEARFGHAHTNKGLHFMARTYENLLKLVQDNDRNGVREFLDARVPVDNAIVAAAAKTGDTYLVNMLLAEMTDKKRYQKPEKPMLAVLGTSHFEVVKTLIMTEQFNPHYHNRQGKSWVDIAEERQGPNWRQEKDLLQRLYDDKARDVQRRSSSPVSKRDQLKRKPVRKAPDDDSEEDGEGAPARKKHNGRRLMSRKDMRAARVTSESSSLEDDDDEDEDEDAPGSPENVEPSAATSTKMKPPESPPTKRSTTGRPRTQSLSAQGNMDPSPRTRRRSNSLRGTTDQPLPSLEEQPVKEAKEEAADRMEDLNNAEAARRAEAKFALEQAQRLEAKRREDAAAEAEAKKKEEEAEAARAEEARKAQEAREKAEQERLAKQREEEERQAEEIRRKEAESAEAKRQYFETMISSLPAILKLGLDPASGFFGDGITPDVRQEAIRMANARQFVARYCLPLQATTLDRISVEPDFGSDMPADELYVLNVQAANLLGYDAGKELLIPSDSDHAVGTLARKWHWLPVKEESEAKRIVKRWQPRPLSIEGPHYFDENMAEDLPFMEELKWLAERANKMKETERSTLRNPNIELRWLRLRDVMDALHAWYRDGPIEVVIEQWSPAQAPAQAPASMSTGSVETKFVDALKTVHGSRPVRQVWRNGQVVRSWSSDAGAGSTKVVVKHEK